MRATALCLLLITLLCSQTPAKQIRSATSQQAERVKCTDAHHDSRLMVDKVTAPREIGPQPEGAPAAPHSEGSWSISLLGLAMLVAVGYRMRYISQPTARVQVAVA